MRDPDLQGGAAKGWRSGFTSGKPEDAASIVSWFVHGPFHPAWSWWVICAVDLAEHPGVPEAKKRFPEAAIEISIVSLNPDIGVPDVDSASGALPYLTPLDLVWQGADLTRTQTEALVKKMVEEIVAGRISPDSDYRRGWEELLPGWAEQVRYHVL